jgi:glycosyltransferase involved in cell wall biosynthesis
LRIGLYIPHISPRPAGMGRYTNEISSSLAGPHDSVILFTQSKDRDGASAEQRRVGWSLPGKPGSSPALRRASRLAWLSSRIEAELRKADADVLLSPSQEGPVRRISTPSCLVVHDLTLLKHPTGRKRLDRIQARVLLPRMLEVADAVVAVSESTRNDIVELFDYPAEGIHVVYEGVDGSIFFPRESAEVNDVLRRCGITRPYILYSGTLAAHKNVEAVLEALRRLPSELTLVISGVTDRQGLDSLREAVQRMGLGDRVRHAGYLAIDDLARLMTGAAAFVFPSRYEGFGLAPVEAMACGAPVLASNAGSLPEVLGDAGSLLSPDDSDAWAAAIHRLLRSSTESARQRDLSRRRAHLFNWSRTRAELLSVLGEIADA